LETENYTDYETVQVPKEESFSETEDERCHCSQCQCSKCNQDNFHLSALKDFLYDLFRRSWFLFKFSCLIGPLMFLAGVSFLFGGYCQNWYIAYLISGQSSSISIVGYIVGGISIGLLITVLYCKIKRRCCFRKKLEMRDSYVFY